MFFVYWVICNLLLPRTVLSSFQSGMSSSIGVLSTAGFPTSAAENLPFDGVKAVKADCGWSYAAAGNTSPGYYLNPNFGNFNLGFNNVGQANVGYGNTGYGNYGQNNQGRLNNGNNNIGYLNDGSNNMGALNTGNNLIGDNNSGTQCVGHNNTQCTSTIGTLNTETTFSIGTELQGDYLFGASSTGIGLIGQNNQNQFSIGFQNVNGNVSGNIGVMNSGDGLVGYNNTGSNIIGQSNVGQAVIGLENSGNFQIGYNNTAVENSSTTTTNYGYSQIGTNCTGTLNDGTNLIGFNQVGNDNVGGVYIDNSAIDLNPAIIFNPEIIPSEQNIGTNFNAQPANEVRLRINTPFIQSISTTWRVFLEFPAVLSVVDLGCAGDVIEVFDEAANAIILVTNIPSLNAAPVCAGENDPDASLADPTFSRGFVTLPAGPHALSFFLGNGNGGTALAFRFDSVRPDPDCPECTAPVPLLSKFCPNPIIEIPIVPDDLKVCEVPEPAVQNDPSQASEQSESASKNTNENASEPVKPPAKPKTQNLQTLQKLQSQKLQSPQQKLQSPPTLPQKSNPKSLWCESKRFQMLRNTFLPYAEAANLCTKTADGLATPNSPAAQLEITSLLFQCRPSNSGNVTDPEALWIASDWTGKVYKDACLYAHGEKVLKTKNCNHNRRFICNKRREIL